MQSEYLAKKNNRIHKTAIINWEKVELGVGNVISPYVCIGMDAQSIIKESDGIVKIGDNNTFREFTSIHLPTKSSEITLIGNNNYFMCNSHVSHDCKIEDKIVVAVGCVLNGHVNVMVGAYIGTGAVVHQYQTIGSYSIVGMNSTVTKTSKIIPGGKYIGSPARHMGINKIALDKNNVSKEKLEQEILRYRSISFSYLTSV